MWDLPGSGIKPVSPALSGRFFTTEPPGKPRVHLFLAWGLGEQALPIGQMYILILLEMGKPEDHGNEEIRAFHVESGLGMSQEPGVELLKKNQRGLLFAPPSGLLLLPLAGSWMDPSQPAIWDHPWLISLPHPVDLQMGFVTFSKEMSSTSPLPYFRIPSFPDLAIGKGPSLPSFNMLLSLQPDCSSCWVAKLCLTLCWPSRL